MTGTRLRRGSLVLASLAVHAVAIVGVAALARRAPVAPLFVDFTEPGRPSITEAPPGAAASMSTRPGPAGGGTRARREAAVREEAGGPTSRAPRPLPVTEPSSEPTEPTDMTPPAPPSLETRERPQEAAPPGVEHPAPSSRAAVEPARGPAELVGSAPPSPAGNTAGSPAPGGGRASDTGAQVGAAGAGRGVSAPGGARLVLALPGSGRGEALAEYGPYLARFRRSVEDALVYPLAARRQGLAGRVELDVLLDAGGRVTAVEIHSSSTHGMLDEAGIAAVRSLPPMPFPEGVPRRSLRIRLPLDFQLR